MQTRDIINRALYITPGEIDKFNDANKYFHCNESLSHTAFNQNGTLVSRNYTHPNYWIENIQLTNHPGLLKYDLSKL